MKNLYSKANAIRDDLVLLDEKEVKWKFCINENLVLIKDKTIYDKYIESDESRKVDFYTYMSEVFCDSSDTYIVESSLGEEYDDYYSEEEISSLINEFPLVYIDDGMGIRDSTYLYVFEEYFVYKVKSDLSHCENSDIIVFDEIIDDLTYIGRYNSYFDIQYKMVVQTQNDYYYDIYKDAYNTYYEIEICEYKDELSYACMIDKDTFYQKFMHCNY